MNTEKKHKNLYIPAIFIIGIVGVIFSSWRLFLFIGYITRNDHLTISQWVRGLIVPHSMLVLSLGVITAGVILAIRHAVIQKRIAHK